MKSFASTKMMTNLNESVLMLSSVLTKSLREKFLQNLHGNKPDKYKYRIWIRSGASYRINDNDWKKETEVLYFFFCSCKNVPFLRLFFRLLLARHWVISPVSQLRQCLPLPWLTATLERVLLPFESCKL